jgi:hypothetical protein
MVAISIIFNSFSFWFGKSDLLAEKTDGLMTSFATYPGGIFKGITKWILLTIIPVGIANYLPVDVMRSFNLSYLLIVVGFTIFIMIISFEILRESDLRIPSTQGTAISILGGLVLGDAAVSAGIISPIMIIVVAISAISGMVFQSMEVVNAIRFWRFILIILSSIIGLYGIFIGIILIIINITDTKSIDEDYLYPLAPINFEEQKDGFIRIRDEIRKRNPVISDNRISFEHRMLS